MTASNVLRYTASLALLIAAAGIVIVSDALYRVADQTRLTEVAISDTVKTLPVKLDAANRTINTQLSVLNSTVSKTSVSLTAQAGTLQTSLSRTLTGVDGTTTDLKSVLASVNKAVSNPDIPALVRDARMTVALTGSTMAHIRSTANTVAEAAPAVAKSVQRVADAAAGVTADVHVLTTDLVKPKPWYRKVLSYLGDGVKIAAIF